MMPPAGSKSLLGAMRYAPVSLRAALNSSSSRSESLQCSNEVAYVKGHGPSVIGVFGTKAMGPPVISLALPSSSVQYMQVPAGLGAALSASGVMGSSSLLLPMTQPTSYACVA